MSYLQQKIWVLFFALMFGCSINEDKDIVRIVGIEKIKNIRQFNNTVIFDVICLWGSSCGSFSHYEVINQQPFQYDCAVYGKQPKESVCAAAMSNFLASIEIKVPQSGTYTFRFSPFDSLGVDTTMTIQIN